MKALAWLASRPCAATTALAAAYRTRRTFRRHRLTPDAQKRLRDATRRRTP